MMKDIFEQLKDEHNMVRQLLDEAETCPESKRMRLIEQIEQELIPHARGEEKTLYSVVLRTAQEMDDKDTTELANEAYEEHRAVDQLLEDIRECDPSDDRWMGLMKVIKENLEHHIEEEEEELFKKAEAILSEDELSRIHNSYIEAKEKFQASLPSQSQISERRPAAGL